LITSEGTAADQIECPIEPFDSAPVVLNQPRKTQRRISHLSRRSPGIDLLRGLSILLVVLNHMGLRLRLTQGVLAQFLPKRFLKDTRFNGSEAVYLFFVISGFLIAINSLIRWGRLGSLDARGLSISVARIAPCLVTLVAILCVLHLARVLDPVIMQSNQSLCAAVASASGLYLNWQEAHTGCLPAVGMCSGRSHSKRSSRSPFLSYVLCCAKTGRSAVYLCQQSNLFGGVALRCISCHSTPNPHRPALDSIRPPV
jgi:hypothetical protein